MSTIVPPPTDTQYVSPAEHVAHFRDRVLQDALTTAAGAYWTSRAAVFEWARPRPGDYHGQASPESLRALDERCKRRADECRRRAATSVLSEWGAVA